MSQQKHTNERYFINWLRHENRYPYRIVHITNVILISIFIGKELGFSEDKLMELGLCAVFYDSGLATIPDTILKKQGVLTPKECAQMEVHVNLYAAHHARFMPDEVFLIAAQHHENWDGSGYPKKKKRVQIHESFWCRNPLIFQSKSRNLPLLYRII